MQNFRGNNLKPDRVFLILGVMFGLVFLFLTPPFQSPDEYTHFFRAYAISEGNLLPAQRLTLPKSIVDFSTQVSPDPLPGNDQNKQSKKALFDQFQKPFSDQERVQANSTSVYIPLAYLPQSLGVLMGRILRLPPILIFYLGRLANLAVWIGLITLAIRTTPIFQWVLLVLALLPMSIFQGASNSTDALLNSLSFLCIAVCLRLAYAPHLEIKSRDYLVLGGLLFAVSLIKPVYILLGGLYFLIPVRRYGGIPRYILTGSALFLAAFLPSIAWFLYTTWQWPASGASDLPNQMQFLQAHPLEFIGNLGSSMLSQAFEQWKMWVGVLGWIDTRLPDLLYIGVLPWLVLVALFDCCPEVLIHTRDKVIAGLIFLTTWVGLYALFYLTWTPTGIHPVEGVQGRYFIPVFPLALIPFYNSRLAAPRYWQAATSVLLTLILLVAVRVLLSRYYAL